jgi:hypothetical protein
MACVVDYFKHKAQYQNHPPKKISKSLHTAANCCCVLELDISLVNLNILCYIKPPFAMFTWNSLFRYTKLQWKTKQIVTTMTMRGIFEKGGTF